MHEACLGALLLPPGRDPGPSQGYPQAVCCRYPFIHLGEERQSGVKFLQSKETTRRARLEPGSLAPEFEVLTARSHSPTLTLIT